MFGIEDQLNGVALRPIETEDFQLLVQWINMPHVARWWDGFTTKDAVISNYGPRLEADSTIKVFVIEMSGCPVGIIQCYRHRDHSDWDKVIGIDAAAGIDYLIGDPASTGKGIGPAAIRAISDIAFNIYPDVEVIISAPQKDNRASWLALEKAGFERIDERKLRSDCPSDSGISYLYARRRGVNR